MINIRPGTQRVALAGLAMAPIVFLAGCAPSDPATPPLGLSRAGNDIVAWTPLCSGESPRSASVSSTVSGDDHVADRVIWSAKFASGVGAISQTLVTANSALTAVQGSYVGTSPAMVEVVTSKAARAASARFEDLPVDGVLYEGRHLTETEFRDMVSAECFRRPSST